jgi:type II secretory pathway pseudopilin PulG
MSRIGVFKCKHYSGQKTRAGRVRGGEGGFSLIEVLFAIGIMAIMIVPVVTTIQTARIRAKRISLNLVGQNLAVAMMEMTKRAAWNDLAYGRWLPAVLDTTTVPTMLLDFPRQPEPDSNGDDQDFLPPGPPSGATEAAMETFLAAYREGTTSPIELADDPIITSDVNYYFFSQDQVAELNGFDDWADIPDEEKGNVLDPQFAWGLYIADGDPNQVIGGGFPNTGLRHVAIIVKWIDPRNSRRSFAVLEGHICQAATRLSL